MLPIGNRFTRQDFNSRSRTGSDSQFGWQQFMTLVFQFTLPHRERRGAVVPASSAKHFNSRSRTGSDLWMDLKRAGYDLFQFTLPHRERPAASCRRQSRRRFQFTLPHRERPLYTTFPYSLPSFQFTLPHRERLVYCLYYILFKFDFNSRSRTGSDARPFLYFSFGF